MGSSDYSEELREQIERQLADLGTRLASLPSSNRELLDLLRTAEHVLSEVWQAPPKSTADALVPTMQAIVAERLLRHSDAKIQTTLASCLSEIIRITVPDAPYPEELMKEIFQLIVVTLRHLPRGSGRNYRRAAWIVKTMAVVRYCLIMLDLQLDAMIVEMFQIFFETVRRTDPPSHILKSMETVMVWMINESEEVSVELLTPLLDSVRKDNENTFPLAWKLGKTVCEKCVPQLECYLGEAMELLKLDVKDYADIVATICNNGSNEENTVVKEVVAAGLSGDGVSSLGLPQLERISEAEEEHCTPQTSDGNENILGNENSKDVLRCSQQIVQFEGDNARSDAEGAHIAKSGQPETETETETETEAVRRIRSRKPNTLMKPEEGYEHSWMIGCKCSYKVSCDSNNEKELLLPLELGKTNIPCDFSYKEFDFVNEGTTRQRSHSYKKKRTMNLDHDPEQLTKPRGKIRKSGVKETGIRTPKKMEKGEGSRIGTDLDDKAVLLLQELGGRKEIIDENISQKPQLGDDENEMVDFPVSKPASGDSAPENEKKLTKSSIHYGEELVNARISVWWPLDEAFYTGTVVSFDPLMKKHKIKYDDDEEELLNMEEERWEFFNERESCQIQASSNQEAETPSHSRKPIKTEKKTIKRKAGSSKPPNAVSSSKRAKTEGRSLLNSGKSTFRYINLNEDSEDDLF